MNCDPAAGGMYSQPAMSHQSSRSSLPPRQGCFQSHL